MIKKRMNKYKKALIEILDCDTFNNSAQLIAKKALEPETDWSKAKFGDKVKHRDGTTTFFVRTHTNGRDIIVIDECDDDTTFYNKPDCTLILQDDSLAKEAMDACEDMYEYYDTNDIYRMHHSAGDYLIPLWEVGKKIAEGK